MKYRGGVEDPFPNWATPGSRIAISSRKAVLVMFLPEEIDPWEVVGVIEIPKYFHQQSRVHGPKVSDTQTSPNFWATEVFPLNKTMEAIMQLLAPPEEMTANGVNGVDNPDWKPEQ